MTFSRAVRTCLRKYVRFSGRASRPEYWWFALFLFLGSVAAGLIDRAYFADAVADGDDGPVASIFALATLVPAISAGWRRMHDTGRSGLYLIYPLIVMVGIAVFAGSVAGFGPFLAGDFEAILAAGSAIVIGIALVVFFVSPLLVLWWLTRPGDPGRNRYGSPP